MKVLFLRVLFCLVIICPVMVVSGQGTHTPPYKNPRFVDTSRLPSFAVDYVVINGDTMPYTEGSEVIIGGGRPIPDAKEPIKKEPTYKGKGGKPIDIPHLRYIVRKVYPYALTAKYVMNEIDEGMAARKVDGKRQKAYKKSAERQMSDRFASELKDLSVNQGIVLVKLINRETGRDCYSIIKQLKGGLSARFWQTAAFFYHNNLKRQYDPFGDDAAIELLVKEIEGKPGYKFPIWHLDQTQLP